MSYEDGRVPLAPGSREPSPLVSAAEAASIPRAWRIVYSEVVGKAEAFSLSAFGIVTEETLCALEDFAMRARNRRERLVDMRCETCGAAAVSSGPGELAWSSDCSAHGADAPAPEHPRSQPQEGNRG